MISEVLISGVQSFAPTGVIEYSEIGEARAKEEDSSGGLKYNAANICLQARRQRAPGYGVLRIHS